MVKKMLERIDSPIIEVKNLSKVFLQRIVEKGFFRALKGYLFPQYIQKYAVNDVTFSVKKGERVAFIGPNGAGKSTVVKILTGVFQPTSGEVKVFGQNSFQNRMDISAKTGVIFGQRSQLWYHLSALKSFLLIKEIYQIPTAAFERNLSSLTERFELSSFLTQPVKQLSLGQRMRCEIAANLLHDPEVLFLDEPTIGLDLLSKMAIRDLILDYSRKRGMTIFLTSHDMADIEQICDRAIVIDKGSMLLDTSISALKKQLAHKRMIKVSTLTPHRWEGELLPLLKTDMNGNYTFQIDTFQHSISSILEIILKQAPVNDLTVEMPSLEEVIKEIYLSLPKHSAKTEGCIC